MQLSAAELSEVDRLLNVDRLRQAMLHTSTEVGTALRVHFRGGVATVARGDCSWEVVFDQLHLRPELAGLVDRETTIATWRTRLVDNLSRCHEARVLYGKSQEEWVRFLAPLKQPGFYNGEIGDLALAGLAHMLGVNILLVHTSSHLGTVPLTLIDAECFGHQAVTPIPIVMAYNGEHMESLCPVSEEDVRRTMDLVPLFKSGRIGVTVRDIPSLRRQMEDIEARKLMERTVSQLTEESLEDDLDSLSAAVSISSTPDCARDEDPSLPNSPAFSTSSPAPSSPPETSRYLRFNNCRRLVDALESGDAVAGARTGRISKVVLKEVLQSILAIGTEVRKGVGEFERDYLGSFLQSNVVLFIRLVRSIKKIGETGTRVTLVDTDGQLEVFESARRIADLLPSFQSEILAELSVHPQVGNQNGHELITT